mgnify:FL=1
MKWICTICLIVGHTFAAHGQHKQQRSILLTEQSVDSLLFYGVELGPGIINRSKKGGADEQNRHKLEAYYNGDIEEFPDVNRQRFQFHLSQEQYFFPTLYQSTDSVFVVLHNVMGERVLDAKVYAGQLQKISPLSRSCGCYPIGKSWEEPLLKVKKGEKTGYFKLGSQEASGNYNFSNPVSSKANGYIALSKPRYRITDSLQFKVFVLNEYSRPYTSGLRFQITSSASHTTWPLSARSNSPGSYHGFRQLSDSLYEGQFWLQVFDSLGNKLLSKDFSVCTYELPEYAINALVRKNTFSSSEAIEVYLNTYMPNQWPAVGLRYQLLVSLKEVLDFDGQVSIPLDAFQKLYSNEGIVDPGGLTAIEVPDSILPVKNASYHLKLKVFDASGVELYQWSEVVKKAIQPEPFKIVASGGNITLEVMDTSKEARGDFSIDCRSRFGHIEHKMIAPGMPWPNKEGIVAYTLYRKDSQVAEYTIPSMEAPQVNGYRNKDSIIIEVSGSTGEPFFYRIIGRNGIVKTGTQTQLSYKAFDDSLGDYRLELFYSENGVSRLLQEHFSHNPSHISINVRVPRTIAPGAVQHIVLKAVDGNGKPMAGVDITAFANDARLTDVPHTTLKSKADVVQELSELPTSNATYTTYKALSGAWFSCLSMYGSDSLQSLLCPGKGYRRIIDGHRAKSALAPLVRDSGEWRLPDFLWVDGCMIFSKVHYRFHTGDFVLPPGRHNVEIGYHGHLFRFEQVLIKSEKSTLLLFEPADYPRYLPFSREAQSRETDWFKEALAKSLAVDVKPVNGYHRAPLFALHHASGSTLLLNEPTGSTLRKIVGLGRSYYLYPFDPLPGTHLLMNGVQASLSSDSFYVYSKGELRTKGRSPSRGYARLYLKPLTNSQPTLLRSYSSADHFIGSKRRWETSVASRKVRYAPVSFHAGSKEYLPTTEAAVDVHFHFEKGFYEQLRLMHTRNVKASAVLDVVGQDQRHFQLLPGTYLFRATTKGYPKKYYFDTIEVFEKQVLYYAFKKGRLTIDRNIDPMAADTLTWAAKQLIDGSQPMARSIDFLGASFAPAPTSELRFQIHQAGNGSMVPLPDCGIWVISDNDTFELRTGIDGRAGLSSLVPGLYRIELIAEAYNDTLSTFLVATGNQQIEVKFRVVSRHQYQLRKEVNYPYIKRKQEGFRVPQVLNPDGLEKLPSGALRVYGGDGDYEGAHLWIKKNGVVLKKGVMDYANFCYLSLPVGEYTLELSHVSFGKRKYDVVVERNLLVSKRYELENYFHELKTVVIRDSAPLHRDYIAPMRQRSAQASPLRIGFKRNKVQPRDLGPGVQIEPLTTKNDAHTGEVMTTVAPQLPAQEGIFRMLNVNSQEVDSVRDHFSELAYWEPALFTNRQGKTHFQVKFPDDLTTWKHYFIAMDQEGRVGLKYATSRSFKTIHTSLSVPRFVCQGDSLVLTAQHFNYQKEGEMLNETFSANDGVLQQQTVELDHSKLSKSYIKIAVEDSLKLACSIGTDSSFYDKVSYTLQVKDTTVHEQLYTTELILPGETRTIQSKEKDASIAFFPSTNAFLDNLRQQLAGYRYGCVEQTSSKLLALVYEARLCKLTERSFSKGAEVDQMVKRLIELKNDKGLWGWWNGQETDWWMVAYATRALLIAQEEGFETYGSTIKPLDVLTKFVESSAKVYPMLELLFLEHGIAYSSHTPHYTEGDFSVLEQLQLLRIRQLKGATNLTEDVMQLATEIQDQLLWGDATYRMEDHVSTTSLCALEILFYEMQFKDWYNTFMMPFLTTDNLGNGKYNTLEMARIIGLMANVHHYSGSILVNGKAWEHGANEIHLRTNEVVKLENTSPFATMIVLPSELDEEASQQQQSFFTLSSRLKKGGVYTDSLRMGDNAIIEVELYCMEEQEKLMLEVPFPAGCTPLPFSDGGSALHHRTFNDAVSIFCGHLSRGRHVFHVPVRASYQGSFTMLPVTASLMYFDFVTTTSASRRVVVLAP